MLGMTWEATLNGALDEILRRDRERQAALDALTNMARKHPGLEGDRDLTAARMALLK